MTLIRTHTCFFFEIMILCTQRAGLVVVMVVVVLVVLVAGQQANRKEIGLSFSRSLFLRLLGCIPNNYWPPIDGCNGVLLAPIVDVISPSRPHYRQPLIGHCDGQFERSSGLVNERRRRRRRRSTCEIGCGLAVVCKADGWVCIWCMISPMGDE